MKIGIAQLEFIDKTLRDIAVWLEQETGLEFTITSIYRIGDDGVHGQLPVRGLDLRARDDVIGTEIESLINLNWVYDTNRQHMKCAMLHGKGSNMHLHIQTHPNTIKHQ